MLAGQVRDVIDTVPLPAQGHTKLNESIEQALPPKSSVYIREPLASVDLGDMGAQHTDGCTKGVDDHGLRSWLVTHG